MAAQKAAAFSAIKGIEEGITPLFAKKQSDFEKLENIRENASLRNLESTESSADSKTSIESSHLDSETSTESKGILKNGQGRNLSGTKPAQSTIISVTTF